MLCGNVYGAWSNQESYIKRKIRVFLTKKMKYPFSGKLIPRHRSWLWYLWSGLINALFQKKTYLQKKRLPSRWWSQSISWKICNSLLNGWDFEGTNIGWTKHKSYARYNTNFRIIVTRKDKVTTSYINIFWQVKKCSIANKITPSGLELCQWEILRQNFSIETEWAK